MVEKSSMVTPLKRANALGSAHKGAHNWWLERLTSVALVPLTIWFIASIITLLHSDHPQLVEFLQNPINALLMVLLIGISFYHTVLGLQVIIEDYIHKKVPKLVALTVIKLGYLTIGVATLFAVAKLHFSA